MECARQNAQKKQLQKNNQKIKYINLQVHKSTDTRPGWMCAGRQSAQKKQIQKHTQKKIHKFVSTQIHDLGGGV